MTDKALSSLNQGVSDTGDFLYGVAGGNSRKIQIGQFSGRNVKRPEDYGAVGDGATDDSIAFNNALSALATLGGGTLACNGGKTYIVEGIELKERVYINLNGAILKAPSTPSASMFLGPSGFPDAGDNSGFQGGGILNGELDGRDKSRRGVDFTTNGMGRLERFVLDDVYLHDFSRAYSGSSNDRQPSIVNCRLHDNTEGVHIVVNHPYIRNTAFRTNGHGITGDNNSPIQDLHVTGCIFAYNTVHVAPGSGGEIQGCQFNGCIFYKHSGTVGVSVNADCFFVGCEFVGVNDSDVGVAIDGRGTIIAGCNFGYSFNESASDCFGTGAIRIGNNADELCISGCHFWVLGDGPAIYDNNGTFRCLNVSGNTARIAGGKKFIAFNQASSVCAHCVINGNAIELTGTGLGSGDGIIEIDSFNSTGGTIANNAIAALGGSETGGAAIALGDVTDCIITGNKIRNFTDAFSIASGSTRAKWASNVGSSSGISNLEEGLTWYVLAVSAVAASHTGDTNETTLATVTLPGGAMGANGCLRVTSQWTVTDNVNDKTMRVRLGGVSGSLIQNPTITDAGVVGLIYQSKVQNRNSESSQILARTNAATGGIGVSPTTETAAQDTSGDLDIVFRALLASASDTITLESYLIEVLHQD